MPARSICYVCYKAKVVFKDAKSAYLDIASLEPYAYYNYWLLIVRSEHFACSQIKIKSRLQKILSV